MRRTSKINRTNLDILIGALIAGIVSTFLSPAQAQAQAQTQTQTEVWKDNKVLQFYSLKPLFYRYRFKSRKK